MNPNQIAAQGYASNSLPMNYASGTAQPQLSLNEKLQVLANGARNLSAQAFEIGLRLGCLQPVPASTGKPVGDNPHAGVAINDLDAALSQLTDDLQRIRAFVG